MANIKNFFVHFSHFFSGILLTHLFSLITFPILTRAMTIEQYGIFSLINSTLMIAVVPAKAGIPNAIIRFHSQYTKTKEDKSVFASTIIIYGAIFTFASVILYLIGLYACLQFTDVELDYRICFLILAGYLLIRPVNIIGFNFLRVNGKTIFINSLTLCAKILSISVALLFFLVILKKLYGFFFGHIVAEVVSFIVIFTWFFKNYKIDRHRVSNSLIRKIIIFGFPLLLNEIGYLLLSYADRYIVAGLMGKEALGIYSVGYNLAMYISNVVTFALSYAVVPIFVEIYENKGREETEAFLRKSMHYLLVGIIPICFGYYAISEDLFILLASKKFSSAAQFSWLILVGNVVLGLNSVVNAGLYLKNRSMTILYIMLISVVINIILNFLLIPKYGIIGASLATLTACAVSSCTNYLLSAKHIIITFNRVKLLLHFMLSIIMFYIVNIIVIEGLVLSLVVKIICGILIIAIGNYFIENELRQLLVNNFRTKILKIK